MTTWSNHALLPTAAPLGLAGFANMIFTSPRSYAVLMFVFMALTLAIVIVLMRGRLGYYLLAVREDEDAARAAGISVTNVKLRATALSAALTAVGGALFAMYVRTIDPLTLFSLPDVGVKFALLTLIGGMGTIAGPILGAFLIIPLESYFRASLGGAGPGIHLILLGFVMLLAALFMRRGIVVRSMRSGIAGDIRGTSDRNVLQRPRRGQALRWPRRRQRGFVRPASRGDRQHHRAQWGRQDDAVQPADRAAQADVG
jgi:branched-chain amino acid transport system permease protein